jgi:phosphate transport system protein
MRLLAVTRSLERIADGATNIAEDVFYLAEGEIARHGRNHSGRSD